MKELNWNSQLMWRTLFKTYFKIVHNNSTFIFLISHLLCSTLVAQDWISLHPVGVSEHLGHRALKLETPQDILSIDEVLKDGISIYFMRNGGLDLCNMQLHIVSYIDAWRAFICEYDTFSMNWIDDSIINFIFRMWL